VMAMLSRSVMMQKLMDSVGFGWSTIFIGVVMLGLIGFTCAIVSYASNQRKGDQLETRVTSVLHPQKARENLVQPPETSALPGGVSPQFPQRSPNPPYRLSAFTSSRSPKAPQVSVPDPTAVPDMPPMLDASGIPLPTEARLLVAKDVMLAAAKGGDLMLLAPYGAPLMRANVRKVDGELWLEVSMHAEGSTPCAMVRLTNKDAMWLPAGVSFFGPKPSHGSEIYGPDGSFYGTVEINSVGAKLISSTTALPVLDIGGDIKSLQLTVRTKSGLELATVSCHGTASGNDNVDICVHRGADLGLVVASVLTVFLSFQV